MFLFHWKDECQHVVLDELELKRHDATLSPEERDGPSTTSSRWSRPSTAILQVQAKADAAYFAANCGRTVGSREPEDLAQQFLKAYRWQYIFSGAAHPRFQRILKGMITEPQFERIGAALTTLQ